MTFNLEFILNDYVRINKIWEKEKKTGEEIEITIIFSKCTVCGQYFNSIKDLRNHKNKDHRITNAKMRKRVVDDDNTAWTSFG